MSTARLFYLTLPSGRTMPVTAFTCAELVDIVSHHYSYPLGSCIAQAAWNPDSLLKSEVAKTLTEVES